ncbi:MAG TPA: UTP--glucose-1-phosphate uridylyltransferase [Myxococcota bacterium]|nr:UTP--glucose-1-phosphate uridylyltransferase [Myxococcota bacterium]HRY92941.1 UTP--glucose-1-phosphate uridylyltransferase [Myxococcota bacterium]HSA19840.1 UTP--glucose-1-phosphate uridylyltransferase [Myxococcota bacterium]
MERSELFRICPALGQALAAEPQLATAVARLLEAGLAGVLTRYLADAPAPAIATCLRESLTIDLARVELHRELRRRSELAPLGPEDVEPVALVTLEQQAARQAADTAAGEAALAAGRVAALAFAGGAGTRFFSGLAELEGALPWPNEVLATTRFDAGEPKGVFPISPVRGLSFYELILADALALAARTGRLPWVLMLTSSATHARTRAFLERAAPWGFPPDGWLLFDQSEEPRLDVQGELIAVDDQGHLASTGDGHGGVYRALLRPAAGGASLHARLLAEGVEHLVMHNVDNAAARPFAPARIGFHLREDALFTLSATRKAAPEEKVGVPMRLRSTGRIEVVEYNVLDPALARLRDPATGRLVHEAGNINTSLVALAAVRAEIEPTLYTGKKIASRRGPVESSSLEMLNQHLTRLLDPARVRAYEVRREDFFMPTKNVTGVDSAVSTSQALSRRAARLLTEAGAALEPSAMCDLASCDQDLAARGLGPGWLLGPGARLYVCARNDARDGAPVGAPGLTLEEGASLVADCARPYGRCQLLPGRRLVLQPEGQSRLRLGRGLVVRRGVRVRLRVAEGGSLRVGDGRVFAADADVEVGPGQRLEL